MKQDHSSTHTGPTTLTRIVVVGEELNDLCAGSASRIYSLAEVTEEPPDKTPGTEPPCQQGLTMLLIGIDVGVNKMREDLEKNSSIPVVPAQSEWCWLSLESRVSSEFTREDIFFGHDAHSLIRELVNDAPYVLGYSILEAMRRIEQGMKEAVHGITKIRQRFAGLRSRLRTMLCGIPDSVPFAGLLKGVFGASKEAIEVRIKSFEVRNMEREEAARENLLQVATLEEVKEYDPRVAKLVQKISRMQLIIFGALILGILGVFISPARSVRDARALAELVMLVELGRIGLRCAWRQLRKHAPGPILQGTPLPA